MIVRWRVWGVVALAIVVCLAGAGGWPASAAGPQIGFAYQLSVGNMAAAVADKGGFFAREGLSVKGMCFSSGPLINEALASGSAQFGIMGDVPTIMGVASGLPVKILGEVGGGERRNRVMVAASSRFKSFLDLKGMRIGITKGTSAHGALFRLCAAHGLEPTAFRLVHLEPPDMPEALASGQVEAVVVWEPTPTLIEAKGIGRELLSLAGYGNSFPMCVLGSTRFAKAYPEETRKVMRALARASRYIEENPDEAAQLMSSATGQPAPVVRKSMGFHYFTVRWVASTLESLKQTTAFLIEERTLRVAPDWNAVVDTSFLP